MMAKMAHYLLGWKSNIQHGQSTHHNHDAIELVYHAHGSGQVHADEQQPMSFAAGDVQIMPRQRYHTQYQHRQGVDCCILFEVDDAMGDPFDAPIQISLKANDYPTHELLAMSILPRPQNDLEQQIADCRLTAAILQLLQPGQNWQRQQQPLARPLQIAEQVHTFIRSNWRQIDQLQQIADAMSMSLHYLRHAYQHRYGVTLYQALTHLRIEHGCDLLQNSQLPLKAIARTCGFADIQQFSRRFKQITHMAPGQYRKQALNLPSQTVSVE